MRCEVDLIKPRRTSRIKGRRRRWWWLMASAPEWAKRGETRRSKSHQNFQFSISESGKDACVISVSVCCVPGWEPLFSFVSGGWQISSRSLVSSERGRWHFGWRRSGDVPPKRSATRAQSGLDCERRFLPLVKTRAAAPSTITRKYPTPAARSKNRWFIV